MSERRQCKFSGIGSVVVLAAVAVAVACGDGSAASGGGAGGTAPGWNGGATAMGGGGTAGLLATDQGGSPFFVGAGGLTIDPPPAFGGDTNGGAPTTCGSQQFEQKLITRPLDIYFIFDKTSSMGEDCAYTAGTTPPVASKACYATYALADYLINVAPIAETRFALNFMSISEDDCDGVPYATPAEPLQLLPVAATASIIQLISDQTFERMAGTHIEGALRGIAQFTAANKVPERDIIGVLMTDGDPNGCDTNIRSLSTIIADHLADTGIPTFIIGMQGATESNLEQLADAGGAEPHDDACGQQRTPCNYWNVGDASGAVLAEVLTAIISQSTNMPCVINTADFSGQVEGVATDWGKLNVTLNENGAETIIGQAESEGECPRTAPAWYYDNMEAPTTITLCPVACDLVKNSPDGAQVNIKVGCENTVKIPPELE